MPDCQPVPPSTHPIPCSEGPVHIAALGVTQLNTQTVHSHSNKVTVGHLQCSAVKCSAV